MKKFFVNRLANLAVIAVIFSLISCKNVSPQPVVSFDIHPQKLISKENNQAKNEKINIKLSGGADLLSWKQQPSGAKVVDANKQKLLEIKLEGTGKIKFKNSSDQVLGYIAREKGIWKLENPRGDQYLYLLERQDDGNYRLEDTTGNEVYQITSQDDNWKIETSNHLLVYRIKIAKEKISLINQTNTTILYTKSKILPIAFACLGFDILTREQQVALAYTVNLTSRR